MLALVYFQELNLYTGSTIDFEKVLPSAIREFAPTGVLGLLLAGLLAAFMSTFAATVNAAPAYLVNDIYRRRINPNASRRRLIGLSYAVSVGVVVISAIIGLAIPSINTILQWIVSGLWGGYTAANVLKWYWWRFNGFGFFAGMLTGIVGALILPLLAAQIYPELPRDILPLYSFPVLLALSAAACIVVSLATPPDNKDVLQSFYRQVRPWGFWRPIREAIAAQDPDFAHNTAFKRDMFNIVLGIVTQTTLVALPMYVVIKAFDGVAACLAIIAVCGAVLKRTWYDKLED